MYLTNDFIGIQEGFETYQHKDGSKVVFSKYDEDNSLFILTWNRDKTFYLQHIEGVENKEMAEMALKLYLASDVVTKILDVDIENVAEEFIIARGRMENIITFFKLMIDTNMCSDSINLPSDIVDRFITSTYEYSEPVFEWTTKTLMSLLASEGEYEGCAKIRNHYIDFRKEKNWNTQFEIEFT